MTLVKELSKNIDITVISSKVEDTKSREVINSKLRIFRFKPQFYFSRLPYTIDIFLIQKILKVCKRKKCDVIIGYSLQFFSCFSAAIAAKLGGIPFVLRIVGASETTNRWGIDFFSKIYDNTLAKLTLKFAKKIFVQTKRMKERPLNLGAQSSRISVVEDGINLTKFSVTKGKKTIKQEFNVEDSRIVVTFISRLVQLKGIEDFITVAKELVKKFNDIVFFIVGTGPLERTLKKKTNNYNNIFFLGYRKDINIILKMSDIFVLPSYSEGLSPAILEACASALPIITTNVGSSPDIIENGVNGFLIEPGDKSRLKESIIILKNDKFLREDMGKENKKRIFENYQINKVANKFLLELEKIRR